jgi:hypothetical protein
VKGYERSGLYQTHFLGGAIDSLLNVLLCLGDLSSNSLLHLWLRLLLSNRSLLGLGGNLLGTRGLLARSWSWGGNSLEDSRLRVTSLGTRLLCLEKGANVNYLNILIMRKVARVIIYTSAYLATNARLHRKVKLCWRKAADFTSRRPGQRQTTKFGESCNRLGDLPRAWKREQWQPLYWLKI